MKRKAAVIISIGINRDCRTETMNDNAQLINRLIPELIVEMKTAFIEMSMKYSINTIDEDEFRDPLIYIARIFSMHYV